jgi:multimeric flavodoxin WrbA
MRPAFCRCYGDRNQLVDFLREQGKILTGEVFEVGRQKGLSFDEIYRILQSGKGDRGLSNSEGALVAGLWGAHEVGADITHCGLSKFFPALSPPRRLDELRDIVCQADALLLSGPVYFGDRGSLAQEFLSFLREDEACREHIRDKVYGGIAVGAKRNGGQETALVYQLVDTANLGMLGVGNDSESTSQYGGTLVAGDVGTLSSDSYGIDTAIGTGRRVARVADMLDRAWRFSRKNKPRVAIWLLQDMRDHHGRMILERFSRDVMAETGVSIEIMDFTDEEIGR